ncbi:unnamed protein product [Leuciscus chuanchicus]
MLPVSFVEGEGFRELMIFIEPEYTIPTRKTITTRVENMHGESATDLRGRLANARTVDQWGLTGKVTACVHDNGKNMVLANANDELEWDSQPCFTHSLQLAINDDRSVTKLSDARTLELTDDSWIVMEEILPMLHSLKCATTALCGEYVVSISMVYPVTITLLSKYLKEIPGENAKVKGFKSTVSVSLERRFGPAEVSNARKVAYIASFLDPRHKHLRFATDDVRGAVQAETSCPALITMETRKAQRNREKGLLNHRRLKIHKMTPSLLQRFLSCLARITSSRQQQPQPNSCNTAKTYAHQ